jgi:hypothetical protein
MRIWKLIPPILLVLTLGSPARALVIDDFEGGAFSYMGGSAGDGGSQDVGFPAQVLGGTRQVFVQSNTGSPAIAELTLSTENMDAVALSLPPSGGLLELGYEPPAPFDLTLGGGATEIEVSVPLASAGATLEVELTDTLAGAGSVSVPIALEATSFSFPLADFSSVDPTRVETIKVRVISGSSGVFVIPHIALVGDGEPLSWQVVVDQVSGPPYPSSPVEIHARMGWPPDPVIPIGVAALSIVEAKMSVPPDDMLPFELVAMGNGEVGSGGEQVGIEANWLPEPLDEFPDEADFELKLELQPLGGVTPRLVVPPDDGFPSPESFRVSFTVLYEDDQGQILATARHHLHFQIGTGQPLEFNGVSATQGSVYISFGTTKMGIQPSPFVPIFIMTMSAEFTLGPPIPAVPPVVYWLLAGVMLVTVAVLGRSRLQVRRVD